METEFEVGWSDNALAILQEIRSRIAPVNPAAADKLVDGIMRRVEMLQRVPLIGKVFKRDRSGRTREIVYKKRRIFYQCPKKTAALKS